MPTDSAKASLVERCLVVKNDYRKFGFLHIRIQPLLCIFFISKKSHQTDDQQRNARS